LFLPLSVGATEKAEEAEEEIDYTTLENPIPFTKQSIGRGRVIFKRLCTECHGPDGKGQMDVIADASDLTVPKRYYSGSTVGEVYASIRIGAGTNMPPFLEQLPKEDDLWHLVNFIQSLWPEKLQPELVEEEKEEESGKEN
jgi:putative copper resistance protein D